MFEPIDYIVQDIYGHFAENLYEWRKDGTAYRPSEAEIREHVIRLAQGLTAAGMTDNSLIESGRVMTKSDGNKIDVWLWMGELDGRALPEI